MTFENFIENCYKKLEQTKLWFDRNCSLDENGHIDFDTFEVGFIR